MFERIIDILTTAAGQSGIDKIQDAVARAKDMAAVDSIPNIVFVSDSYGKKELLRIVSCLCEETLNTNVIPDGDVPVSVSFAYGDDITIATESISVENTSKIQQCDITKINYGLQKAILKDLTITLYCGIDLKQLNNIVFDSADYLFLLTNATMALPMSEKDWIKENVARFYDYDRFAVVLYNAALLNTDEDFASVCENIELITKKINPVLTFCRDYAELHMCVNAVPASAAELEQKRKRAILRNCLNYASELIHEQLEACNIDIDKLKSAVDKVEAERKSVEIAGKIAVKNIIEKLYENLRFEIVNAANDYNDDVYNSIARRLADSKNLSGDLKNVQSYLESAWKNFESKTDSRIAEENEVISQKLAEQIEIDCGKLIKVIDIPGMDIFLPEATYYLQVKTAWYAAEEEEIKKQKMISKGVLAATIALTVFGHPLLGISAFAGSKIYEHFSGKGKINSLDSKQELLAEIKASCDEIMKGVIQQISVTIESAKQQAQENIAKVYGEIIESLVESIGQSVEKVENVKDNIVSLQGISDMLEEARQSLYSD